MNRWDCLEERCDRSVTGTGGAIGLRTIGWYVRIRTTGPLLGPVILCPAHHPDGMDAADRQAEDIQFWMTDHAGQSGRR